MLVLSRKKNESIVTAVVGLSFSPRELRITARRKAWALIAANFTRMIS